MYVPGYSRNQDMDEVKRFIKENSFGILVCNGSIRLQATHIPLELSVNEDGKDILTGHISKANRQWKNFKDDNRVLVIFNGPHAYISSSWYDHENVPTWNYIAVHVYGTVKIIEGEKLLQALKHLVDRYESKSANPVSVEKMSEKFLSRELKGIVGFEIEIEEILPAYKLSQNRDEKNHASIVGELEQRGDHNSLAIAGEMKKHKK
jgi:transcriptional regulator